MIFKVAAPVAISRMIRGCRRVYRNRVQQVLFPLPTFRRRIPTLAPINNNIIINNNKTMIVVSHHQRNIKMRRLPPSFVHPPKHLWKQSG